MLPLESRDWRRARASGAITIVLCPVAPKSGSCGTGTELSIPLSAPLTAISARSVGEQLSIACTNPCKTMFGDRGAFPGTFLLRRCARVTKWCPRQHSLLGSPRGNVQFVLTRGIYFCLARAVMWAVLIPKWRHRALSGVFVCSTGLLINEAKNTSIRRVRWIPGRTSSAGANTTQLAVRF